MRESLLRYVGRLEELLALLDDPRVSGAALRAAFARAEAALAGVPAHAAETREDPELGAVLARAVQLNAVVADRAQRRVTETGTELSRSRQARERLSTRSVPDGALGRLCDLAG